MTVEQVNEYLDAAFAYGPLWVYAVIWAACFVENLFPPFPGDTFILVAGALVGFERLDIVWTVACVNSAGVLSVLALYVIGRKLGRGFFVRRNLKYFNAEDVNRVERDLNRYGGYIILASRFVVGIRAGLAVAAGIGRYPAARMALFSTISYLVFTGLLLYLGYAFGRNFDRIEDIMATYKAIVLPLVIVILIVVVVLHIRRKRKRTTE